MSGHRRFPREISYYGIDDETAPDFIPYIYRSSDGRDIRTRVRDVSSPSGFRWPLSPDDHGDVLPDDDGDLWWWPSDANEAKDN
jgi:hypothetical protein